MIWIFHSNLATPEKCQYKNEYFDYHEGDFRDFTCDEPLIDTDSKFCIFHDINYLKDDDYEKNKEEVAKRFENKLSEYSSNEKPFEFIGYCLPEISFQNKQFTEALYFNEATFYGFADFRIAKFSKEAVFYSATFSEVTNFDGATFSGEANFTSATFSEGAHFVDTFFVETSFLHAVFPETASFNSATFSEGASFGGATFSGEADFRAAKFSKEAVFNSNTFSKYVDFREAKFSKEAKFNSTTFSENVDFAEATFSGEADFRAAKFSKEAKFNGTTFSDQAYFSEARFSELALFSRAKFFGTTDFSRAEFSGKVEFYTEFSGPASFAGAMFFGELNFSEAKFHEKVNFSDARFLEVTYFLGAKFQKAVDFSHTEFIKRAYFRYAEFLGESIFYDIFFHFRVTFLGAKFTHALFYDVFFKGKATFREAQMHKVKFYSVEFQGKALFLDAQFLENTEFNHTTFGHAVFTGARFNGETKFNHVVFAGGEKTFFDELKDNNDLSKVSFMDSDITRIRFSDKVNWGGNDGFTIIEERRLREELEKIKEKKIDSKPMEEANNESQPISPESVLSVYRNLRENYEFRLRYGDAGKFFIKEMELKREYREAPSVSTFKQKSMKFKLKLRDILEPKVESKPKENGWWRRNFFSLYVIFKRNLIKFLRKLKFINIDTPQQKIEYIIKENGWWRRQFSLTGVYYHFSTYGESIVKPVIIGAIIVGFSTLFWLTQKDPTKDPSFSHIVGAYWILINHHSNYLERAFERSLADFLPVLSLPTGINVGVIDYIIKIVGGVLTFGLLAIALRRKFERKYTR